MPNYRRANVPGGTFFFTIKTEQNRPIFDNFMAIRLLGQVIREAKARWPMTIDGIVLLPDHWHTLWTLPSGDSNYFRRIGWIKKAFTQRYLDAGGDEVNVSASRRRHHHRGVWQRRFWEHTVQDERDFDAHLDYIHFNPVKHGYATCASAWPHSSFQSWVERGVYHPQWGCDDRPIPKIPITKAGE